MISADAALAAQEFRIGANPVCQALLHEQSAVCVLFRDGLAARRQAVNRQNREEKILIQNSSKAALF